MKKCKLHGLRLGLGALLLVAGGCSKSEGCCAAATATAVPTEAPTIAILGTPQPGALGSAAASALAPASVTASAAAPASPVVAASSQASASVAASGRDSAPKAAASAALAASAAPKAAVSAASAAPAAPPETTPLKPASTRIAGKNFTLDVASPGCRVDAPCAVTLRLVAAGEFHVNKEYPYRFTAAAAPGVQFLGNGDATVFSRAAGDFREDGEKAATMTVRFKPSVAGEARVAGTYKLSVCSATQCQVETQTLQLAVPVM